MTEKLYWIDAYQKEFDAKVIRVEGNKIVLDKTCFFARSGGQSSDTGYLDSVRVIDAVKDDNSSDIFHVPEGSHEFKKDDVVHGKIDWKKRYAIMKLHSASHLVYYVMQAVFGPSCKNASSGLISENKSKIDYYFEEPLDPEKLALVNDRVNWIIKQGHDIETGTRNENERYWKVSGFPEMPCGGTHVKNTSEIGEVTVKKGKKPGKGRQRIEVSLKQEAN
ncbi:MAG: alanyl-tRNA editing protein [Candidatus Diapherotrites archaeon]|nr:alanyl-tRNA editing protein [Candidatus Diapherotrites archaeon]